VTRRTWLGIVLVAVALVLGVALYVALIPLDSGDNFCGNAFVARGHNNAFNGCDERLRQQRIAVALPATAAVVVATVAWRRLRQRPSGIRT
jgi:hypothetical protein